jgi:hypothetical protein
MENSRNLHETRKLGEAKRAAQASHSVAGGASPHLLPLTTFTLAGQSQNFMDLNGDFTAFDCRKKSTDRGLDDPISLLGS